MIKTRFVVGSDYKRARNLKSVGIFQYVVLMLSDTVFSLSKIKRALVSWLANID